jgi:uncharacterized membrane protein YdjX (TVP38/TMEM64 family)
MTPRKKFLQVLGLVLGAAIAFSACRAWGHSNDCSPHQVDGQCGLATAMGDLFGTVAACLILTVGMIVLGVRWYKASTK